MVVNHRRFFHLPGTVRLQTLVHLCAWRHECLSQPVLGSAKVLCGHSSSAFPGAQPERGAWMVFLCASLDGREKGQRCLILQASKGWTSKACSQGDVQPSFGHQGHLSPLDVSVEPAWSPASKDAALKLGGRCRPVDRSACEAPARIIDSVFVGREPWNQLGCSSASAASAGWAGQPQSRSPPASCGMVGSGRITSTNHTHQLWCHLHKGGHDPAPLGAWPATEVSCHSLGCQSLHISSSRVGAPMVSRGGGKDEPPSRGRILVPAAAA